MAEEKTNIFEQELDKVLIDPIVKAAAEERPNRDLESDDQYSSRIKKQIHESMREFSRRIQHGVSLIKENNKWPEDADARMRRALENLAKGIQNREEEDKDKEKEAKEPPKTLQQLAEFTTDELVSFYSVGLDIYNRNNYDDSGAVFLFLTQLNPRISAFWSGLGAAEEMQQHFQEAAYAYVMAAELEASSLDSCLRGANCLIKSNKTVEAKKLLELANERINEDSSLERYKKDIDMLLKQCD